MSENDIVFTEGIVYDFGQMHTFTLPKSANISEITIRATIGALSGGATGTYVVNTAIQSIKLRVNSKDIVNFDGLKDIAGIQSMGIATMREFFLQIHGVALTDDDFVIELPDAIPKNMDVQLVFTTASSITAIQSAGGDRTTLASSTIDILYQSNDKIKGSVRLPFINWTLYSHGARTGNIPEYVPALTLPLRKLMLITYDGTTLSSTTYDELGIEYGHDNIKKGTIAHYRSQQAKKSRVANSAGHIHIGFKKGMKVPAGTLKLNFIAGTAGTTKFVHLAWLCYA